MTTDLKLGLVLGYWFAGPPVRSGRAAGHGRGPRLRLGVVGRGLRLRLLHPARLVRRGHQPGPPRHRRLPDGGPHPGGHGHDRPDAWTTSPRAGSSSASAPRARRWSRAGTASPTRSPLARTREYVDVVRQVLAREEPVQIDGQALPAAPHRRGHHRPGQGAQVDHPPAPGRPPDLPRRRGTEERGPRGRDRRRLAADVHVARPRPPLPPVPGGGVGPTRCPARPSTTSRSPTWCRS